MYLDRLFFVHDCCSVFAWALCLCRALQLGNVHGEPCLSNVFHMDLQELCIQDPPNIQGQVPFNPSSPVSCYEGTSHVYSAVPVAPKLNGHGRTIIPPAP